ncbi:MAG TPA: hypothetical protein DCP69_02570 [Candidatus Omnitrophica bacterium]|nr:hypothetical protein [Candidatus Omnitrophota bacterium]
MVDDGGVGASSDGWSYSWIKDSVVATSMNDGDGGAGVQGAGERREIDGNITDVGPVIGPYSGEVYAFIRIRGS